MRTFVTGPDIHQYMLEERTHPSLIYRLLYQPYAQKKKKLWIVLGSVDSA